MQDLGSSTRDGTTSPAVEVWRLKHWTTREVPICIFFFFLVPKTESELFVVFNNGKKICDMSKFCKIQTSAFK